MVSGHLKIVSIYFTKPEAELAKGLLETEGIVCVLKGDDAGGAWPNLSVGMGNYSLWVDEKDLQKAKEVLMPVDVQDSVEPVYRKKNFLFAGVVFLLVFIALMGGIFGRDWLRVPPMLRTMELNRGFSAVRTDACHVLEPGSFPKVVCYEYYFDGTVYSEANYLGQQSHGPFSVYYPDGSVRSVSNFVDGKLEGRSYEYYPNGKVHWEWTYKDDQPSGTDVEYYDTGEIRTTYPHDDGLLEGNVKTYYPGGRLANDSVYSKDKLLKDGRAFSGTQKILNENGHIWMQCDYKDGLLEGKCVEYDQNSVLIDQAVFKANQMQERKEFYPNGKLKTEIVFRTGMTYRIREFGPEGHLLFEEKYSISRD